MSANVTIGSKTQHIIEAERLLNEWHDNVEKVIETDLDATALELVIKAQKNILAAAQVHATLANAMSI